MNLNDPLNADEIDFRVQSINKGGYATILAYKDARIDMQRLDESVGPMNWKREHCRDNHNCIVSLWDSEKGWVSKEDTGTESFTEAQKGLASDAFKRACFNWGIGRELYDYPFISIKLNGDGSNQKDEWFIQGDRAKQGWGLKLKQWRWGNGFKNGKLAWLCAYDDKNTKRFEWGDKSVGTQMLRHNIAVRENLEAILEVKQGLKSGEHEMAAEAWLGLPQEVRDDLNLAPTKGGVFSVEDNQERNTNEFKNAVYNLGDN